MGNEYIHLDVIIPSEYFVAHTTKYLEVSLSWIILKTKNCQQEGSFG